MLFVPNFKWIDTIWDKTPGRKSTLMLLQTLSQKTELTTKQNKNKTNKEKKPQKVAIFAKTWYFFYSEVIMNAMASQATGVSIVY